MQKPISNGFVCSEGINKHQIRMFNANRHGTINSFLRIPHGWWLSFVHIRLLPRNKCLFHSTFRFIRNHKTIDNSKTKMNIIFFVCVHIKTPTYYIHLMLWSPHQSKPRNISSFSYLFLFEIFAVIVLWRHNDVSQTYTSYIRIYENILECWRWLNGWMNTPDWVLWLRECLSGLVCVCADTYVHQLSQ